MDLINSRAERIQDAFALAARKPMPEALRRYKPAAQRLAMALLLFSQWTAGTPFHLSYAAMAFGLGVRPAKAKRIMSELERDGLVSRLPAQTKHDAARWHFNSAAAA